MEGSLRYFDAKKERVSPSRAITAIKLGEIRSIRGASTLETSGLDLSTSGGLPWRVAHPPMNARMGTTQQIEKKCR